jgi:hypothetical protein
MEEVGCSLWFDSIMGLGGANMRAVLIALMPGAGKEAFLQALARRYLTGILPFFPFS